MVLIKTGPLPSAPNSIQFASFVKPILLGEYLVNPAVQNNKITTYLITDAFKSTDQQLDDTEEIEVKLIDFEEFGNLIMNQTIVTQFFTASAYHMAKSFLNKKVRENGEGTI